MDFGFLEQQYLSRALLDYANPGYWEGGGLRGHFSAAVYKRKFWVILCCANPIVVCCGTIEL